MDELHLGGPNALVQANVFYAKARAVRDAGDAMSFVGFYEATAVSGHEDEVLNPIEAVAQAVNIEDEDKAARTLAELVDHS